MVVKLPRIPANCLLHNFLLSLDQVLVHPPKQLKTEIFLIVY